MEKHWLMLKKPQAAGVSPSETSNKIKRVEVPVVNRSELRNQLIKNIEKTVLDIIQQINQNKIPEISYLNKSVLEMNDIYMSEDDSDKENDNNCNEVELIKSKKENRQISFALERGRTKMVRLMIVLSKAYKLLLTNKTQTKRSLFYELKAGDAKELFINELVVDRIISDAANLFSCATWDLGFVATAKGLIFGDLQLQFENGCKIDCSRSNETLVPPISCANNGQIVAIESTAEAIVVVEKEAIFHRLLTESGLKNLSIILITGKGYPDRATRIFLKLLEQHLKLPVFILVDGDPHGFEIMCSYKYGSKNVLWERGDLICPQIEWIGVYPSEMVNMCLPMIPLSNNDQNKLKSLGKRGYLSAQERKELEIMMMGKTEIEALACISPSFLTLSYIPTKINNYKIRHHKTVNKKAN
ncbi:meiotic recombination protein SPO11 [Chelonus insularis]|uniref:meiotic recombination protein SPO11 n=1 Tax=Chelonus insularis TaxID=460826 RepID=UPI00158F330A|nr:meiotic recombination protein SPO11 [Chelonus insularis]